MIRIRRKVYWLALVLVLATGKPAFAADVVIGGVVTDDAGRPIRGATVKVTSGLKSVSRYSTGAGRFQIAVPVGAYDLEVQAFGFSPKWQLVDTAKLGKLNISLSSAVDVSRLTPAEIESVLPDNAEIKLLKMECEGCHNLHTISRMRGLTADGWKAFLPVMPQGRVAQPPLGKDRLPALAEILGKYFGPDSQYFGPDAAPPKLEQIAHAVISDAALKATVTEYKIPTPGAMPNEVRIDGRGQVWFGDVDATNQIGRLDPLTAQFQMYPLETPNSYPISGLVGRDGTIWWSLLGPNVDDKLVNIDPRTGKMVYYKSMDPAWAGHGTHRLTLDAQGNIWSCGSRPSSFDVKTKTFKIYQLPQNNIWPEGSAGAWINLPGLPELSAQTQASTSSIAVDSKGMVYMTRYYQATILRFDPATGEVKEYQSPGMISPRGVEIDENGFVWFADSYGHQLGRLDPKTGAVKLYHPPTKNAYPYAANIDRRTGYIYYSDYAGNQITRFDPQTETFVEFPLPTPESFPKALTFDEKGRIWYAAGDPFAGKIGVIDPAPTQSMNRY